MEMYPERSQLAELRKVHVILTGANGADLSVDEGVGAHLTAPRTGEGAYTLTITGMNPGTFKGWRYAFGAATPADTAGHTAVRDTPVAWDGTSWTMPFVIYNSSFAADDLLVNEYIDIELLFGLKE